jgi:hypothetical protein
VTWSVRHTVKQPVSKSAGQSVSKSVTQSASQSVSQSLRQPVSLSVNQSLSQLPSHQSVIYVTCASTIPFRFTTSKFVSMSKSPHACYMPSLVTFCVLHTKIMKYHLTYLSVRRWDTPACRALQWMGYLEHYGTRGLLPSRVGTHASHSAVPTSYLNPQSTIVTRSSGI